MKAETLQLVTNVAKDMVRVAQMVRTDTNELGLNDHIAVIVHFDALRIAIEQIKQAREALQEITDHLSKEIVPTSMRNAGVKTVTVEGVGRVTVSHRYSCSIIDKDGGYKWLRDNEYGSLIVETVNSSTLSAFAKNLMETEGKELPDNLFKVGTQAFTSITKR